jgi:hypothetical protein
MAKRMEIEDFCHRGSFSQEIALPRRTISSASRRASSSQAFRAAAKSSRSIVAMSLGSGKSNTQAGLRFLGDVSAKLIG